MTIGSFISDNKTILSLVAFYVGSAAISSLPPPQAGAHPFYQWFYKFANTLFANVIALRGKAAFEPKPTAIEQQSVTHTETVTTATEPKP